MATNFIIHPAIYTNSFKIFTSLNASITIDTEIFYLHNVTWEIISHCSWFSHMLNIWFGITLAHKWSYWWVYYIKTTADTSCFTFCSIGTLNTSRRMIRKHEGCICSSILHHLFSSSINVHSWLNLLFATYNWYAWTSLIFYHTDSANSTWGWKIRVITHFWDIKTCHSNSIIEFCVLWNLNFLIINFEGY